MTIVDARQADRDTLLLQANLRVAGSDAVYSVEVRNLSSTGLMAEGSARVLRGTVISIELPQVGWVDGTVAWTQGNRFGIAFIDPVDAKRVQQG